MTQASANPSKWIAFTDGACSGNPGPGGWGSIVAAPSGQVRELGGFQPQVTNNQMELCATIEALRRIPPGSEVEVYTDSTYVIKGITQWIWNWLRNGWKTAEGKDISNRELWESLNSEIQRLGRKGVHFNYVRGHAGIPGNERVDEIAVSFSKRSPASLYEGTLADYGVDLSVVESSEIKKSSASKKASGPGAVYLSLIGTLPAKHANWADCERRVKGQSGARFKKVQNRDEEIEVLKAWGVDPDYFLRAGQ